MQKLWAILLKKNKKLKFYSSIKKSLTFEKYLDIVRFYKDRILFTKFRCSDHNLAIEKGRYSNVERKNRICKLCQIQVETEKHYQLFCPKFNKFREKYMATSWLQCIRSEDTNHLLKIIRFIRKAEKIRISESEE